MASRYSPEAYASRFKVDTSVNSMSPESAGDKKNASDADMWRFIGDVAPAAGTALGGIAGGVLGSTVLPGAGTVGGATIGAGIGNALGQAVGAGSKNHAEGLTADRDDEAANKEQRRQEMLTILMGMRR